MEITGKIIEIFETQQVTDKFQKREFVVEYAENPQYPEVIKMEMIQDKCEHLDGYTIGDMVTVSVNLKGRAWTDAGGKKLYFNTIQAWRMQKTGQSSQNPADNINYNAQATSGETDELPF